LVWVNGILVAIGLWQLARERELSRLRSDFVAGVSHELRTPLAQIRMFAETLLLDRIRNPAEGRRALEIISRETRRLGQLVDNVLIFHRHERVQPPSVIEDVQLDSLIRDVVGNFEPLAAARQSTVRYEAGMSRAVVRGNPDGLRQVVLNLLDNAFKFGPSGQTVRVAQEDSQESVRIIVEDSGPGIPPHDRQRVFKAFERGRNTRGAGGAGIGLAVVRQIVDAHNGTVAVETAASGGARFIVTLPATHRPSDEEAV
jgi:signal transduction histidine kinase